MSVEDLSLPELVESLRVEQDESWRMRRPVPVEAFFERHPRLLADPTSSLQLVYNEVLLRQAAGESPRLEEYLRRLPQFADQLPPLFEVHEALESDRFLSAIGERPSRAAGLPNGDRSATNSWPTIAGHEILGELGRGGMGVVYKARQVGLNRLVALKVILAGSHADASQQARFRTEAEAVARLQHPNIVQIHQVGSEDGRPYYSMEFVDGQSLAQELDGTPQPARTAAALTAALARAIHMAHQKGIIHRDLKPANILLAVTTAGSGLNDRVPKITDFGLAKLLDSDTGQTGSGAIVGTPSYMAPEQARSNHRQIGPATDVYSLGAILYELLTGRPPFKAQNQLETLRQVLANEPVSLSRFDLKVPHDLETICLKCLCKEPNQRYRTALELADDLDHFLANEPIRARRTPAWERSWRWCKRNPGWAAAIALLFTIAVGASMSALALNAALLRTGQAEHQATDRLFEALLTRVEAGRGSGRPGQRFAGLESIRQAVEIARNQGRPAYDILQLRNEAIACLALPDLQLEADWEGNPPGTNGFNFDDSFERYAWSFKDEGISVRRLKDHVELVRLPTPPTNRVSRWARFRFSADGRYLAAHYRPWSVKQPAEVWDLNDHTGHPVVSISDAAAIPVFAADGKSLLALLPGGAVAEFDLPSGRQRRSLPLGGEAEALALHPEKKLLAVGGGASDAVRVLDLETGAVTLRLPHTATVMDLAWSPDGKALVSSCKDNVIHFWDVATGREEAPFIGHRWEAEALAFDPSGRWLMSFGWDMTLRVWEVATRRELLKVENIRVLGLRRQGGFAAAGLSGRRVQVWSFHPSEVLQAAHCPDRHMYHLAFSPDSHWLATTGEGAQVRIWDVETGQEAYYQPGQVRLLWGLTGSWVLMQGAEGLLHIPVTVRHRQGQEPARIQLDRPRRLTGLNEDVRGMPMQWVGSGGHLICLLDTIYKPVQATRIRIFAISEDGVNLVWEFKISPNITLPADDRAGRLFAAGSLNGGSGVSIWELASGRLVRELSFGDAEVAFSADGKRLFTTTARTSVRGAECQSWSVDTWELERAVPTNRVTSSPALVRAATDGTVAVTHTMSDIRLLNPATLDELATLIAPEPGTRVGMTFSPDSATLAVASAQTIHLWNLRRLRQELTAMGLDWSME
jgi:WD40 repeat protein/predicted Ser/Thr protein kinase